MASEGSASAFVNDLGFVEVWTFDQFMRPGRRPGAFAVIKSVFSTEVPTGTGGGALADLQVEIFVELTPLQPGHHRQHKVGLINRPQEACRRFGLENEGKTPVVLRPLERRSYREIFLVFLRTCVKSSAFALGSRVSWSYR